MPTPSSWGRHFSQVHRWNFLKTAIGTYRGKQPVHPISERHWVMRIYGVSKQGHMTIIVDKISNHLEKVS